MRRPNHDGKCWISDNLPCTVIGRVHTRCWKLCQRSPKHFLPAQLNPSLTRLWVKTLGVLQPIIYLTCYTCSYRPSRCVRSPHTCQSINIPTWGTVQHGAGRRRFGSQSRDLSAAGAHHDASESVTLLCLFSCIDDISDIHRAVGFSARISPCQTLHSSCDGRILVIARWWSPATSPLEKEKSSDKLLSLSNQESEVR